MKKGLYIVVGLVFVVTGIIYAQEPAAPNAVPKDDITALKADIQGLKNEIAELKAQKASCKLEMETKIEAAKNDVIISIVSAAGGPAAAIADQIVPGAEQLANLAKENLGIDDIQKEYLKNVLINQVFTLGMKIINNPAMLTNAPQTEDGIPKPISDIVDVFIQKVNVILNDEQKARFAEVSPLLKPLLGSVVMQLPDQINVLKEQAKAKEGKPQAEEKKADAAPAAPETPTPPQPAAPAPQGK